MNNFDKIIISVKCWDVNDLYGPAMLENLPLPVFEWFKEASQFNKDFIKSYSKDNEGYLMFSILKDCINFIMIY